MDRKLVLDVSSLGFGIEGLVDGTMRLLSSSR